MKPTDAEQAELASRAARAADFRSGSDVTVSLTESQINALLTLALEADPPELVDAHEKVAEAERTLARLGARLGTSGEGTLNRATAPTATLFDLMQLKQLAKVWLVQAGDAAEREAAQLLYKVTIAAAFGRHGKSISEIPIERRRSNYRELAAIFAGQPIGEVFRQVEDRLAAG